MNIISRNRETKSRILNDLLIFYTNYINLNISAVLKRFITLVVSWFQITKDSSFESFELICYFPLHKAFQNKITKLETLGFQRGKLLKCIRPHIRPL